MKWVSSFSWGHIIYYNLTACNHPWPDWTATNSLSFIFYIYIYITEWGEVITIIWRLPIIHDQIERSPILYLWSFILLFFIYIWLNEEKSLLQSDGFQSSMTRSNGHQFFTFYFLFLYNYWMSYIFIYMDCLVFSKTWKQHAWEEGIEKRGTYFVDTIYVIIGKASCHQLPTFQLSCRVLLPLAGGLWLLGGYVGFRIII